VGQYAEKAFPVTGFVGAAAECGTKEALVARKGAFGLPALAVFAFVKPTLHLSPIFRGGPFATKAAFVDRDDGGADAKLLAA